MCQSFVVRILQVKNMWRKKYSYDSSIYFTFAGPPDPGEGHEAKAHCFKIRWKTPIFLRHFINVFLRSNMQRCSKNCRNRRFRASEIAKCPSLPTMVGTKLRKLVDLTWICPCFFTFPNLPPPSFEVGSAGLLCENVKQYLYDSQMKGCRERDVVSNAWNA